MKIFWIALICLLCCIGYSNAATINAETCDNTATHPHVQTAVTAAARGDTVIVPAGSCTWTTSVSITKAIIIQGAGIDATTIKSNLPASGSTPESGYWLFKYVPSSSSADENVIFEVKNFTFDIDSKQNGAIAVINSGSGVTPLRKIKIHGNKIINCNYGTESGADYTNTILIEGSVYGVIYNNAISGSPHLDNYGSTYNTSGRDSWDETTWTPGSADNMYWEDNTIVNDVGTREKVLISNGRGGRYVYRYNTITNSIPYAMTVFDVHGIQVGGTPAVPGYRLRASMGAEIYGNKIINTRETYLWDHRGGRMVSINNYVDNGVSTRNVYGIIKDEASEWWAPTDHVCTGQSFTYDGTEYPNYSSCDSAGNRQDQEKTYYVNNRKASTGEIISLNRVTSSEWTQWGGNTIAENTHYFNHNTSCTGSACTAGVGCGTTRPTHCTIGRGYWETDQSCANTTNMVGESPVIPTSGTLYRCTATDVWTEYFTPYTYPHPLRAPVCSGGNCTAASCLLADVQAAVDATSRGGTVTVPAGACTWLDTLNVTKAITLQGAGAGSNIYSITYTCNPATDTCITSGMEGVSGKLKSDPLIWWSVGTDDAPYTSRITGFILDCANFSAGIVMSGPGSTGTVNKKVRIDHNRLLNTVRGIASDTCPLCGLYARAISWQGLVTGLIDSNFCSGRCNITAERWRYAWKDPPTVTSWDNGTEDNLFVEDNYFYHDSTTNQILATGSGGSYVARYNTFDYTLRGSSYFYVADTHGYQGGGKNGDFGGFGAEIYGNKIIGGGRQAEIRGGIHKIFYNKNIYSSAASIGLIEAYGVFYLKVKIGDVYYVTDDYDGDLGCFTCPKGSLYQDTVSCSIDGRSSNIEKTYLWNNRYSASGSGSPVLYNVSCGGGVFPDPALSGARALRENIDYWLPASAVNNRQTTGVGCGTFANRPTYCTTGTGYWATENVGSCSDLTGLYGHDHTSNISGTLYKCSQTDVWAPHYSPFSYCHPLRVEQGDPICGAPTSAPIILNGTPAVEQACTPSSPVTVNLGVSTNQSANVTCRWGTSDVAYASMTNTFNGTGTQTHTGTASQACGTTVTYYARCTNIAYTNSSSFSWPVTVASETDLTPPVLTNTTRTNQACAKTQRLKVQTDTEATCAYCEDGSGTCTSSTDYDDMTRFTQTVDTMHHTVDIYFPSCSTSKIYNIKCEDTSGNESTNLQATITVDGEKTVTMF